MSCRLQATHARAEALTHAARPAGRGGRAESRRHPLRHPRPARSPLAAPHTVGSSHGNRLVGGPALKRFAVGTDRRLVQLSLTRARCGGVERPQVLADHLLGRSACARASNRWRCLSFTFRRVVGRGHGASVRGDLRVLAEGRGDERPSEAERRVQRSRRPQQRDHHHQQRSSNSSGAAAEGPRLGL